MTCLFLLIITWDFLDSLFFLGNTILKMDYGSVVWTEEKNDDCLRLLCIFRKEPICRGITAEWRVRRGSKIRGKSEAPMDYLFWTLAAAAQRNNSWCFCGLTQLTSCLTGYTLRSLHPALPVPFLYTGTHTHFFSITTDSARQLPNEPLATLGSFLAYRLRRFCKMNWKP